MDAPTLSRDALPLRGLRVLECSAHLGVAYAGRLLADLGADVVNLELPTGDPLRHRGPYAGGRVDPERSAAALALHAGKRSVVIDAVAGDALVGALLAEGDIVLRDLAPGGPLIGAETLDAGRSANPA